MNTEQLVSMIEKMVTAMNFVIVTTLFLLRLRHQTLLFSWRDYYLLAVPELLD
jgi:hypothetical protein